MFKNSNMQPAFATAGGDAGNASRFTNKTTEFASFSEAGDDFGSFSSSPKSNRTSPSGKAPDGSAPSGQKAPKKKSASRFKFNFNPKLALIIGAAVLAVVLVIVGIVAVLNLPFFNKGIKVKDDVYIAYTEGGKQKIAFNGKAVKADFKGEVELRVAKDNSFAYIFDETADSDTEDGAITMYILKGTKLEEIKVPADTIEATSDYAPGIVYKSGNSFYHYSDKNGDNFISDSEGNPSNFKISGNGTTVVYTKGDGSEGEMEVYYCYGGQSHPLETSKGQLKPLTLSNDGKLVYMLYTSQSNFDEATDIRLAYVTAKGTFGDFEFSAVSPVDNSFSGVELGEIRAMNKSGTEFIIDAEKDGEVSSYFCSVDKKAKSNKNNKVTKLAVGIFTPVLASDDIICPDSLYDTYFTCKYEAVKNDDEEAEDEETPEEIPTDATYTIKKEKNAPKAVKLADAKGTFSPDGKYFYFLDKEALFVIELSSVSAKADHKADMKEPSVKDFHVVDNGNIYLFRGETIFYKDGKRSDRVVTFEDNDSENSFASCGNTIYFMDKMNEAPALYSSTSSKTSSIVTFKAGKPVELPTIIAGSGKKAYVTFTDGEGITYLYYTKNGKSMALVSKNASFEEN